MQKKEESNLIIKAKNETIDEFVEKLIGRLEVNSFPLTFNFETESYLKYNKVKEIVNQLAEEYNNKENESEEENNYEY